MYEYFEHTADVGIHVRAPDLPTLLAEAGQALFGLIVADLTSVRPLESTSFQITGANLDYLLFDWLSELLFLFDSRRLVLSRFEVQTTPDGLHATVFGEPFDPTRHPPNHEIKAITYHELSVTHDDSGWRASVIVDI